MASLAAAPLPEPIDARANPTWVQGGLFAFALIVGAYFTFRFGGRWSEYDTSIMAMDVRGILTQATILPQGGALYPNGYGFGAISAFVIAFTGLDVPALLQSLYPLISASLALVAWPVYRELTGSARGATLATLLLFVQPEFLFVILRGSHERVMRALILVSFFLLVRSARSAAAGGTYTACAFLLYLCAYAIIATNSLFGSSFVWALSVALVGSWLGAYFGPGLRSVSSLVSRRLIYVPVVSLLLVFLFNSYVYPPAGLGVSQLPDMYERVTRLLLTTDPQTSAGDRIVAYDPYAEVVGQWIDIRVYFLISIGTYLLMLGSGYVWVRLGLRWLAGSGERPTHGQWLLWLLYTAFAAQGAFAILADRSGTLGGNLQYRSFPSFVMVAAPLVASYLVEWNPSRRARALAAGGLGVLAFLAMAKATNEPAISNKWTFYLPPEAAAIDFTTRYLKEGAYWSDFDERLITVQGLLTTSPVQPLAFAVRPETRLFLITDITRLRAERLNKPLPPVMGELRVYDNGGAQLYRRRALTPYQS